MALRLRGAKVELEEAGEDVEGMAESTSQLQAKLLALTHGKVDIMLDENTFKNTTQILREMAGAWEEMTDIERSAALELMGGKRQANILASVIKNFDTVEDVIATSMDSSGSAIAENEKYLDSIQGKIDLFNNSLQTMWMNFIDSKTVKNIVSLGTALIKLVDVIGLIPTGVGLFAGWKFAAAELEKAFGKTNVSTKELKKNINDYINQQKVAGQTATATAQEVVVAEQQKTAAQTQATAAGAAEEAQDKKNIATDLAGAAADKVKAESQKEENKTQIDGVVAGKAEENQDKKNIATDLAGAAADAGAGSTVGVLGKIGTGIKAVGIALGKAFIVMLAVKAATWAIGKAWEALDKNVIHRAEHIKEEVKSLQDSYESMKETLDSNLKTLTTSSDTNVYKTLEDEFVELAKGVDQYGNNLSLTAEQYERYKSICENIVSINPYLASGYDSATAAIGNQADALSHLIDLYKEQAKYEAQQFTSDENLAKVYENAKNEYKEVLGKKEDVSFNVEDAARTAQYIMDAISGTWNGTEETFASSTLGINGVLNALGLTDIDTTDVVGFGTTLDALTYLIANHSDQFIDALNNASDGTTKAYDDYVLTLDGSKISAASIALQGAANNYQTNVDAASKSVENANNGLIYTLSQLFTASSEYEDLNDASKSFLANWLKNSDLFKVDSELGISEMKDKINDMITNLSVNVDAQKILDNIFTIDASKVDYEKYKAQISNLIDQFWMAIGGDSNQLGFTNKQDLAIQLGFNFTFDRSNGPGQTDEGSLVRDLSRVVGENITDVQKWIDSQPAATVQALMRIDWTAEAGLTYDEVLEKVRATIPSEVISVKTYSVLVSEIESYNEVLEQTSEIVSDNTEVTQEYKDSLTALGISEEELADCFDENNGLIVKNADKLKELIKKQKDEYKNNVKTAKSQAKLKYYKLAKDLVNTVKSTKNLTNTQRDHIKTILEEMDSVQYTISKYTMLESELLGVTNAYKKLADAQAVDEATDYGSKAEEMVNVLAEAFNTSELGTEAAQVAIRGLVPDEVIDKTKTLDEQMQQIYSYFTKGAMSQLFTIEFDDDGGITSVEMMKEDVEAFTKSLIGSAEDSAVFQGTWDEFTLNPAITSLEEFADACGLTEEVAFAFLTSLEKYDINWLGGDNETLLDQLMGHDFDYVMQQASQKYAQAAADMAKEFDQVNEKVNMFNRKILYDNEGYMVTMAAESFNASDVGLDGDFAFNVTPILPDGTMLENVEDYIRKHLASGGKLEDMDIFLGSYATLDEAIAKAKRLSELQGVFYENQLAIEEMENKALDFAGAWAKTSDQLNDAREEAESLGRELAGAKNGVNESTGRTVEEIEEDIKKNDQLISDLLSNLDKLKDEFGGEPTEMVVGVALDEVQEDIEDFKKDLEKKPAELKAAITKIDSTGFENLGLTKNADGSWSGLAELDWYQKLDPASQEEVTNYLNMIESEHYLNLLMGDGIPTIEDHLKTISTVLQDIAKMMDPTYTLHADTTDATSNVTEFWGWWNSLGDKVITLYQRTIGSWFGGNNVNGTANVGGSAYAGGKWGAKQTETSLVGELGPEMVVRGNRWFTVGENGAEFTQVKKGDIIFNHKQTEQLLENGHITGRGKAYASGTAYAQVQGAGSSRGTLVTCSYCKNRAYLDKVYTYNGKKYCSNACKSVAVAKNLEKNKAEATKKTTTSTPTSTQITSVNTYGDSYNKLHNDYSNKTYGSGSNDDDKDDAEQTVDFIEMKLEEIEAIITKTTTKIENFLDDTTSIKSKDELYDELVKAEKDKSEAYLKAAQKYNVKAAEALSGVPQEYQEMARNGAIAIEEFLGEDQVEIAEKIQEYRDWAAKADEAENGHLEAIAAISAHRVEQLEDIATDFENIVSISKSHSDLLQAEMDFIEESGNRLSESYYEELKKNSQKQLDDMQAERVALQKILDDSVAAGDVVVGSDDWYSMLGTIYEVDQEIIDCKTSLEEFQNAINELYWDNFDKLITEIDNVNSELSNLYDLVSDTDDVVDEMGNWTDDGITALGLLVQQMENAQFKSEEYGKAIAKLKKDYADGLYSTDEYNEKLSELTDSQYDAIKSYEDAKDAIVDLNKTRVEAVKDGLQKEIDAYSELIEKKKEALDAEKNAYDFQKQVQESDKNIKDIERKIAALEGNTSSSAMAQRKRLEAELLKAKEEQQDMYYNHSIEKQQEALDKELEDYTQNKQDQMDALDEYLKKEEQVIADSFDLIAENTNSVINTLIGISEEYGVTISDTIATPWIDGANAIGTYEERLDTSVSATTANLETLKAHLADLQVQADKTAESVVAATHSTIVETNDGHQTSIKGYAKGSKGVEYDQWALIDELGDELQLVPNAAGRLDYIKKGTGILNNTLTERLMNLAMDPTSMIENSRPVIGTPGIATTNNTIQIDASVGTLLHVEHLDGSNPAEVSKLVDKAWEKKMQTLNNSIKKFTR